ncbi:hypothetical protein DFJ58DRAFT_146183 [Suillus subalutaceus]|uniref:uncharacterized protein n=1 Tax=Suillus subalutaceus TaxID=48586 RepID=UPI001B85FFCB|nr:uncharacterized protein DFJ58DRAFT_146183 [Suillus subalutaceus]KAG1837409.1 hypothetical protein DFJ58DRAFT_146183 [Suillus subalutaceus]
MHPIPSSPIGYPVTVSLASPVTASQSTPSIFSNTPSMSSSTPAAPLLATQTCPRTLRRAAHRISLGSSRAASPVLSGMARAEWLRLGVRFSLLDSISDGLCEQCSQTSILSYLRCFIFDFFVPSDFIFVYLGFRCTCMSLRSLHRLYLTSYFDFFISPICSVFSV